uniref:Pentacotripeptide-repeat region of PRORP domain-containing protein n=1 Tax=Physcomitrium patens TaxID=3218 RepID=A0A7I4DT00_PHYPA
MACFLYPNLNSVPFAVAAASAFPRCSSRGPVFITSLIPASRSFSQPKCDCVHVRAIQGELSELCEVGRSKKVKPFAYNRAKPEERWPHRSDVLNRQRIARELENVGRIPPRLVLDWEELCRSDAKVGEHEEGDQYVSKEVPTAMARRLQREEGIRKREARRQLQKAQVRRLQRDRNWKRALEFYEWLNLRKLYTPNPRLLATIIHILGRANQPEAAQDLFSKTELELTSCIQVYNAILGVHAKQGHWQAMQPILERMARVGCEPDIITFNTIASARCRYGLQPGMASGLLKEIESAGLRPDITTYNILLGACFSKNYITEAKEIVKDMEQHGFDQNSCTSYVLEKNHLTSDGDDLHVSKLVETSQQQARSSNGVWSSSVDIAQQARASMHNSGDW